MCFNNLKKGKSMQEKCNLEKFINDFDVTIKRKAYGVKSFNGFYDANNYKRYLDEAISKFKYDLFYVLPHRKELRTDIYLQNIYFELNKRKKTLMQNSISSCKNNLILA